MARRTGVPVEKLRHRRQWNADQAGLDRCARRGRARGAIEYRELAEERARLEGRDDDLAALRRQHDVDDALLDHVEVFRQLAVVEDRLAAPIEPAARSVVQRGKFHSGQAAEKWNRFDAIRFGDLHIGFSPFRRSL